MSLISFVSPLSHIFDAFGAKKVPAVTVADETDITPASLEHQLFIYMGNMESDNLTEIIIDTREPAVPHPAPRNITPPRIKAETLPLFRPSLA